MAKLWISNEFQRCSFSVNGSEIQRAPGEVASLSHYFRGFYTSQVVLWDFFCQQVIGIVGRDIISALDVFFARKTKMFSSLSDWLTYLSTAYLVKLPENQEHLYPKLSIVMISIHHLNHCFRTWNKILGILFILFSTVCLFGNVQSHRLWRSTCLPRQTCNQFRLKMVEYGDTWAMKSWERKKSARVFFWMVRIYIYI